MSVHHAIIILNAYASVEKFDIHKPKTDGTRGRN